MAGQLTIDILKASSGVLATQNGMTGIAKAWVNFNGSGGATINGSFNVSSVTRNSTGNYTVTFTTAFVDSNYATVQGSSTYTTDNTSNTQAAGSVTVTTGVPTSTRYDSSLVCIACFR